MAHDNYIENRGSGLWKITTYKPEKEFGPYEGWLQVSRDFHVVYKSYDVANGGANCIASFPSPNVAAAENTKEI